MNNVEQIRTKHERLMDKGVSTGSFSSMKSEIKQFFEECARDGQYILPTDDRDEIRSIIHYWVAVLRGISDEIISTPRLNQFKEFSKDSKDIKITRQWENDEVIAAIKARANLVGAYLVDCDLSGQDLSGMDMRGANLTRCNLDGANLERANLDNKTELVYSSLKGAHLVKTRLHEALLMYADLTKADMTGAELNGAKLGGSRLVDVTLNDTVFNGARLVDSILNGAMGKKTKFRDAVLAYSDLGGARFDQPDFENANLEFCLMRDTHCLGGKFRGAHLHSADVYDADFSRAEFNGVSLASVQNLETATWTGVTGLEASDLPSHLSFVRGKIIELPQKRHVRKQNTPDPHIHASDDIQKSDVNEKSRIRSSQSDTIYVAKKGPKKPSNY